MTNYFEYVSIDFPYTQDLANNTAIIFLLFFTDPCAVSLIGALINRTDRETNRRMGGLSDGWMVGLVDGVIDGRMDGWTDAWIDR